MIKPLEEYVCIMYLAQTGNLIRV
ncbi:hypothetical protein F383_14793 [Gossypium arboreum]|uniref:Uncharacterized protein n=1 Tax=Gossypium arboreum TaxID=29729 RepID=A0A0B0PXS8_GOSAR|nr:hypothetical protein F383_16416 [Gossypium arboreum]KHG28246.1 hypothetical protein F383_14793 [Gossypium arboreum]